MSERKTFMLWHESWPLVQMLTDDQRGKLLAALFRYDMFGEMPEDLDQVTEIVFLEMKGKMDRASKSYESMIESRREAGRKGAASRWMANDGKAISAMANDGKAWQSMANIANPNPNPNPIPNPKPIFIPPSVVEVEGYAKENGYNIDANRFVDFYASKGWMVGKTKMKDWKAAVRGWVARNKEQAKAQPYAPKDDRKTDYTGITRDLFLQDLKGG